MRTLLVELCVAWGACGHEVAQRGASQLILPVLSLPHCSWAPLRSPEPLVRSPRASAPRSYVYSSSRSRAPHPPARARTPVAPLSWSSARLGPRSACFKARPELASVARAAVLGGGAASLKRRAVRAPSRPTPARPPLTRAALASANRRLRLLRIV